MTSKKLMRGSSVERIFSLLIGGGRKKYIKEITGLLNVWTQDMPLRSISLKEIHIMCVIMAITNQNVEKYKPFKLLEGKS